MNMRIKASELQNGDIVTLDFGYGPRSDDRECAVRNVEHGQGLFGDGEVRFSVESYGEKMDSSFSHKHVITVKRPIL